MKLSLPARDAIGHRAVKQALVFSILCSCAFGQGSPLDTQFKPPFFVNPTPAARVLLLPNGQYVLYQGTNALVEAQSEFLPQNEVTPITRYNADGSRDNTFAFQFNSAVEQDYSNISAVAAFAGGLYVAAYQQPYGSTSAATYTLLRLNANGAIDSAFGFGAQFGPRDIRGIAVQNDGNILVAGFFTNYGSVPRSGIARVLANGTPDTAFNANAPQITGGTYAGVWTNPVVQPLDDKILIGGDFTTVGNTSYPGIVRLNRDGTIDTTFNPSGFSLRAAVRGIVVQGDGSIVLAGRFAINGGIGNAALVRLNSNGTLDTTFAQVGGLGAMKALAQQADGKFVAGGQSIYRFNNNGSRDATFRQPSLLINQSSASGLQLVLSVNVQANGKILVGGSFTDIDDEGVAFSGARFGVARFNSDGTLDTSLVTSHQPGIATAPNGFLLQPDGNTVVAFSPIGLFGYPFSTIPHNFGRLTPSGQLDTTYDPLTSQSRILTAIGLLALADGSYIVQGPTPDFSGENKPVRVLPDGSISTIGDSSGPQHFDATIANSMRLPDGSLLLLAADAESIAAGNVVGHFTSTGTYDTTFVTDPQIASQMVQRNNGTVITVSLTAKILASYSDGRVLFSYLATDGSYHLVRLQSNGTIDRSFSEAVMTAPDIDASTVFFTDPTNGNSYNITALTSTPGYIDAEIDVGGRAVVVGAFQGYGSSSAKGIVRLNSNGSVDTTFNPGAGAQWINTQETPSFHALIDNIETQGDGKLVVTGTFEKFNTTTAPGIARLNGDGSVDSTFSTPAARNKADPTVAILKRQFDGSFLLSGPYLSNNRSLSPSFIHFFGPPVITSPTTASVTAGRQFFYQVLAYGATSLNVTGLPPGLSFTPALGVISGTVSSGSGPVPVTLSASNAFGTTTSTLTLTLLPAPPGGPVITSTTSATGRTGAPFKFQVITTGGSAATQLTATNVPAGLAFDPVSGTISGIPQSAGSTAVILNVSDPGGNTSGILQLTFSGDAGLPVIVSSSAASLAAGQQFSYAINAPVIGTAQDPTSYNLKGTLPVGLFFDSKTGVISGTYQGSAIHDASGTQRALSGGVITNVQLFATNSHGTSTTPLVFFTAPIGSVNISTRLDVGDADNVLIGGFIVTGNGPKKVLIRAIGPSLMAGGQPVAGALQDTTLDLFQGQNLLGSNDDWRSNQEQEIKDTGVPPTDERESAIVATLQPNTGYTAVVKGKGGSMGIGLAEIYDLGTASLDPSAVSHLANISTRGTVLIADNVMIGGFIISGANTKVLARAIGPSLAAQGVPGSLGDPMLELHDASGSIIAMNDDWRTNQEQQIKDTTVPPTDDRESAIVATLQPGAYTAVVRGKNDSTGVALVEIYSLQ